jgi:hypothetical protein
MELIVKVHRFSLLKGLLNITTVKADTQKIKRHGSLFTFRNALPKGICLSGRKNSSEATMNTTSA